MTGSLQPLVLGHRGARHVHPDNTMVSFLAAKDEGADGVECDVVRTADDVLVLRHDLWLRDGRPVRSISQRDLLAVEPALASLDDLLAWRQADAPGFRLLVELKDPDAAVEVALALKDEDPATTWLGGFHGPALAEAKKAVPTLRTSLMMGTVVDAPTLIDLARRHHCDGIHPCWESRAPLASALLTDRNAERIRDAGLVLTLWHEERREELERLVTLGADAICTDTPGRLRTIVDRVRPA